MLDTYVNAFKDYWRVSIVNVYFCNFEELHVLIVESTCGICQALI